MKQKRLVKKMSENVRLSVGSAMRSDDVGYSESSSEKPQRVTNSKGFREFFGQVFTPEFIRAKHMELAQAKTVIHVPFPYKLKDEEIKAIIESSEGCIFLGTKRFMTNCTVFFFAPDFVARDKALDKMYKITGDYAPEKIDTGNSLPLTDDELDAAIAAHEETANRYKQYKKTKRRKS